MEITSRTVAGDHELDLADELDADPGLTPSAIFEDRKAPGAFRTIGEVARALNIRQHVLRYWEEQFPMLTPVKRSGNRRYYRPEDVALIKRIDQLVHHEGHTLRGARMALEPQQKKAKRASGKPPEENGPVPEATAGPDTPTPAEPWLDDLLEIRATLAGAIAA